MLKKPVSDGLPQNMPYGNNFDANESPDCDYLAEAMCRFRLPA
jgi:hypothetical protein